MFQYPLADVGAITDRSEAIGYYMNNMEEFPFRGVIQVLNMVYGHY